MSNKAFIASDNLITSLGFSTEENIASILKGKSGVEVCAIPELQHLMPLCSSSIDKTRLLEAFSEIADSKDYTTLEQLFILSIGQALKTTAIDVSSERTLFIISTTKGNIDLLSNNPFEADRIHLWKLADIVASYFNNPNKAVVVSNACISGALAVLLGKQMISSGKYDHIVVSGGDLITEFVVSGFVSFKAISPNPCKPFDANRDGLSLGEGCGTIILTSQAELAKASYGELIEVAGGATSNDANHISGPSRTGEELGMAIKKSMKEAGIDSSQINYISAHGTATSYNDEMEAKAFTLCGLQNTPVNSLKGYFGHTLGAAGAIELIVSLQSMKQNALFKSIGYESCGTTDPLNIITQKQAASIQNILKTASGFGGCNVAITLSKK
ncbi:MAG: beta-ketoacyl synthase N-terminal-like domain-containing protein [Bacteroidota bacterium]